ncbi:MAG: T9SS type A sorting domain-containing protein [Chlorobi bacterium]|nr:T9SS type A sorting domain-containing protein [Chlorobiota bacterium]
MKKIIGKIFFLFFILLATNAVSQVPVNYYDSAVGLTGSALKQELHNIITNGHTPISYTGLWTAFQSTDVDNYYENDGSVMDMYSENPAGTDPYNYAYTADQCGTYSVEGNCYNREHSFPKSWWGSDGSSTDTAYTDLNHIFPTDGYVNGRRSAYPYGIVGGTPTWTSLNGCKLGANTYGTNYTGTVFEPIDEFKGDFARGYFYMATRYKDDIASWVANYGGTTDVDVVFQADGSFQPWYYQMLYEWHTNDPVSQKEKDRDNEVYNQQGNANPYITHPEWVCEVFGTCTINPEPDNYPTGFTATAVSPSQIDLSWTDATGTNLPDYYLIKANDSGTFSDPVDGTDPATDTDLSDGSAVVKVAYGATGSYSFTGLSASTTYYFKIWSYTNSGTNIDFKTDGTAPTANATTPAATTTSTCEDFDTGLASSYTTGTQTLSTGDWYTVSVYAEAAADSRGGTGSAARINDDTNGASLRTPALNTVGTVEFYYRELNTGGGTFDLQTSTDNTIWTTVTSQVFSGTTYTYFTYDINDASSTIYVRILNDNNPGHLIIDDFCWTDYTPTSPTLSVSASTLSGFTYIVGNGPSISQSFDLTGTNLDGTDVILTAPADYEISSDNSTFLNSVTLTSYDGTLKTLYVRLKSALSIGTYNGEIITISGGGASNVTVSLDGDVTANSTSDIILETTFTEPSNIPYINYQSADIINDGNDIEVAQFTIRDGGGANDADNVGTTLTDIIFSLTNYADIQRVAIYDGTTEIAEVAGAATVTFTGMTLTASDNGSKTFSIRVSFNSTVTDNDQFQFTVTSATASGNGSVFAAADAGVAQSTIVGDENRIEVTASALNFIQQPVNTVVNIAMSLDPTVSAVDANSNIDVDYSTAVSVSSDGTMTGDPISGTWSSGIATFASLVHTVIQVGRTLTATSGAFIVNSNLFDITDVPTNCATELIISEYIEGSGNNKYLELYNDTGADVDLSNYDLVQYNNGGGTITYTLTLSGILAQGNTYVIENSSESLGVTADLSTTNSVMTFNGNDAVALRKAGTVIDIVGDPNSSTNFAADVTLVRKATVYSGVTTYDATEWDSYATDDVSHLGSHTMICTCNEPTVEASSLTFSNITASSMDLLWTNGNGLNRIVVACEGSPVSFIPSDNTTYTANSSFGSGTNLGSGNYVVYNGSANTFSVTNLTPGTTYYFKIYEYGCQPGSEDYLTSGTPEEGVETTLPNDVTNFQVDCATATTANLSWTLPDGNYDGIMIAVLPAATPDAPSCDGNTLTSPNTDFSAASVYCGNASGAVYVYNNVGTSVTVTGLTSGTSYNFKVFTYKNSSWSAGTEIVQTAEVTDVTDLTSTCGNGESMIAWNNPAAACFDEVIIAVNTVSVTGTPSGTYTANSLDYTDVLNPALSDGSVIVYNGTTSPQTVTGLTNGTTYYFKVFVRNGSDWSVGAEVSCAATTASFFDYGDLAIVGINTHYIDYDINLSDDEIQFVCFKDITTETAIDFTDNGYERISAGKWGDTEGTITLTRTGATVPAGTVITVRGRDQAANWHVFIGSGTPSGTLTNDDANWTITDGGTGNNVFDLNATDQIWMMQGGTWTNPSGLQNATYSGKVLYGWTAIGWEPAPGYDDTKGSTIFPSSGCSVTNLVGVQDSSKVRYNAVVTDATQREWLSRINDDANWSGYTDSTNYQNGGTMPDVIGILGTGFSNVAKWTGETSSDWDDCTNWLNLKVPDATADVQFISDDCFNDIVILPGQTVICKSLDISGTTLTHAFKVEGDATAVVEVHGDVTIDGPAGVLDFDDGTSAADGTLKVYGNWYENTDGAFLEGNSSVELIGSISQSINTVSATADFYNLKVDNSSVNGITLANSALINGTLNLVSGIFNLNGADITISGEFTGVNGVFEGNQFSNVNVNGAGNILYDFNFASPQQLGRFTMNRSGQTAIIGTNLTLDDLQIDAGTVELAAGKYFTVNNSISNTPGTNGLVLKSDATGTASLIQPSANIQATCERYLNGGQWNYIFSPLDNVNTTVFNAGNPNFYWYDEVTADYWDASTLYGTTGWTGETASILSADKGYIQDFNAAKTYVLTGGSLFDPNAGSKVFTLKYTDSGTGSVGLNGVTADWNDFEGWNLIGNPFTSAVDWNQVTLNNVEDVIYYYDGTTSNYKYFGGGTLYSQGVTVNGGSQYVPANQGFFIKATVNNGTVTIPTSARTHNAQSFWKKSNVISNNFLKLAIDKNGFTDETVIRTLPDATENHDSKYDAYKLFSYDKTKPMLYSRNADNSHIYAINSIPEFTTEKIIPLGMYIGVNDYYTIQLKQNGFENMHVYLDDRDLNETINLTSRLSYQFYQNAVDFSDRFYVHFKLNSAPVLNAQIPDQTIPRNELYTYVLPNTVFIDSDAGDSLTYLVQTETGGQLPSWLSFDTETMTFSGTPENDQVINVKVTATDIFGANISDIYKLSVTSSSDVPNIKNSRIRIYPNPTDGRFVVEFMKSVKAKISVIDISGKKLIIKNTKSNRTELDLSSYPKGIYIINIETEQESINKRIILK